MLYLQKVTTDGRFTVSITANAPEASLLLVQDSARSLKELSDVLIDASGCALRAAVSILEAHAKPPSADAVDPHVGITTG